MVRVAAPPANPWPADGKPALEHSQVRRRAFRFASYVCRSWLALNKPGWRSLRACLSDDGQVLRGTEIFLGDSNELCAETLRRILLNKRERSTKNAHCRGLLARQVRATVGLRFQKFRAPLQNRSELTRHHVRLFRVAEELEVAREGLRHRMVWVRNPLRG